MSGEIEMAGPPVRGAASFVLGCAFLLLALAFVMM